MINKESLFIFGAILILFISLVSFDIVDTSSVNTESFTGQVTANQCTQQCTDYAHPVRTNCRSVGRFFSRRTVCDYLPLLNQNCYDQCIASCTSNWQCSDWNPSTCPSSRQQTRTCTDGNNCGVNTGKPAETQSCIPPTCATNWQCSAWSSCNRLFGGGRQQTRTCTDGNNCGVNTGKPAETQSCSITSRGPCTPDWQCSDWVTCSSSGSQTRTCTNRNNCRTTTGKPEESRTCTMPDLVVQSAKFIDDKGNDVTSTTIRLDLNRIYYGVTNPPYLRVVYEIKNQGLGSASSISKSKIFTYLVLTNGVVFSTIPPEPNTYLPGETKSFTTDKLSIALYSGIFPRYGQYCLNLRVDANNTVTESNENNNELNGVCIKLAEAF